jgi:lipoprotein-anchoring transpeptidase ErfK/SrfK
MAPSYYSILSKAVQGKDAAARLSLYDEARALVARLRVGPDRTEEDIAAQADALESAISQIEDHVAASYREEIGSEQLDRILSSGPNWGRIAATVLAVIAIIGLAASAYWYVTARGGRTASESASAPSSRPSKRADIDPVMEDLKPGVDGGSSADILPFSLQRQVIYYRTTVVPGSIVVDRENRFLYLIQSDTSARRYGVGISHECLRPGSLFRIASKVEWPEWRYSAGDTKSAVGAEILKGGPGNPLGARALLLDQPGLLIHGTNSPKTIGHLVATGCIRLVNDDVEDLYKRVSLDTKVIFRN